MDSVEFEISDGDLNLVVELLGDVEGERLYPQAWHALESELTRRLDGAGPLPVRLGRDRAGELSQWLSDRARAHALSTDTGDKVRAHGIARVAIAIETVLGRPPLE